MSSGPALECTPEVSLLLIDGPVQNGRLTLLEGAKVGDAFAVPGPGFVGIYRYIITKTFTSFCADCERLHKRAIARFVQPINPAP